MHPELPGIPPAPTITPKRNQKSTNYLIALTRALHRLNLSPQLHTLLVAVAREQTASRLQGATIPSLALTLGCSYQSIALHLRKNSEHFSTHPRAHPQADLIRLTRTGVELIREARALTKAYSPKK